MKVSIVRGLAASIVMFLFVVSCARTTSQSPENGARQEQELQITIGGHIADYPEEGRLGGECGLDSTRNELRCKIDNGFSHWKLTEVTLIVTWYPYEDDDHGDYRLPASIAPLTNEKVTARLGPRLPPDDTVRGRAMQNWGWTYGPVKGYRVP
jgi:hypothetical protein